MDQRTTGTGTGGSGDAVRRILRDPQALIAIVLILVAVYALRHRLSTETLLSLVVVIPSIMLHEVAHGAVALACGDDTAKRARRLTLNPIRHVDPMGTLILPILLAISGLGVFGYAKPVPINPRRMRHPRNDAVIVSLAGPATNLALAGLSILLIRVFYPGGGAFDPAYYHYQTPIGFQLLFLLGIINVILALFNVLPIPPLDGSALVERFLPSSALPAWWTVRRYAMLGLLILVLVDPGQFLFHIFNPAYNAWARLVTQ